MRTIFAAILLAFVAVSAKPVLRPAAAPAPAAVAASTIGVIPAPPSLGIVVSPGPNGTDDAPALQSAYDQSIDGGTIYLRPSATSKYFQIYSALNWTGTKVVNIDATGTSIYAHLVLSGTQASVTWGGALGTRLSGASWTGGGVDALAVQNLSYCKHIDPANCCLIIQADTVCSYNDFHIASCVGGAGNGSGIIINQLNDDAWCNCNGIFGAAIHGVAVGGKPSPAIWQVNQAAKYGPATAFKCCTFEGSNQVLLNVGGNMGIVFDCCYFEGDWVEGTGSGVQGITWHDMSAKLAGWLSDPRNISSGVLQ